MTLELLVQGKWGHNLDWSDDDRFLRKLRYWYIDLIINWISIIEFYSFSDILLPAIYYSFPANCIAIVLLFSTDTASGKDSSY